MLENHLWRFLEKHLIGDFPRNTYKENTSNKNTLSINTIKRTLKLYTKWFKHNFMHKLLDPIKEENILMKNLENVLHKMVLFTNLVVLEHLH